MDALLVVANKLVATITQTVNFLSTQYLQFNSIHYVSSNLESIQPSYPSVSSLSVGESAIKRDRCTHGRAGKRANGDSALARERLNAIAIDKAVISKHQTWAQVPLASFPQLGGEIALRDRVDPQFWWFGCSKNIIVWQSVAQIMHLTYLRSLFTLLPSLPISHTS